MTDIYVSTPNKGLSLGEKAPMIDIEDIDGENVNLNNFLNKYRGLLIDFFRGSW
jgi:peroxiredoxin